MSKFDVATARSEADWYLEYPDEDKRLTRFAMRMRAACNEIEALEAKVAKLERVKEAATRLARRLAPIEAANLGEVTTDNLKELRDALAACDDGVGYFSHQRGRTEASDEGEGEGETCSHPMVTIDRCDRCGKYMGPQP